MELSTQKTLLAWDVLLKIKEYSLHCKDFNFLCMLLNEDSIAVKADDTNCLNSSEDRIIITRQEFNGLQGKYTLVTIDDDFSIRFVYNSLLEEKDLALITNYLSYSLLSLWAQKHKSTYAISHFAQSLDGKIATFAGESKWIGNEENLVHAHRMRALCDGILIGGNTLKRDCPKLTVRHVHGTNPVKIVVGNSDYQFDSILSSKDKTLFFTSHNGIHIGGLEVVICDECENGFISPQDILSKLYEMNIYSVYIEGGSFTTSQFLLNHALNEIQLYLAPAIMGSGISNFALPAIEGIDEAIHFSNHRFFNMGDGIMFAGRLNKS